jgi:protein-S-isoprenylcysteine O-methyltransferase Ste14
MKRIGTGGFRRMRFSERRLPLLPLIATNAGAALLFLAACLVWNVPELIGMFKQRARAARTDAAIQDRGSMNVLIGLQWSGLALSFALAWWWQGAAIPWLRTPLFLAGIGAMLLGVALRWYAIWTLGSYFTRDVAVSADQAVVQHGVYRFIRHPAYSGTFLTMFGVGLALTNWASVLVLLICVVLGHLYRVRIEEQALIQTIGQPYVAYMRRTKRFIPWIV